MNVDPIEKRSNTMAKILRDNADTVYAKELLLAEMIDEELMRRDVNFNQKLQIVKRVLDLVEIQEPRSKEERYMSVASYEERFTINIINLKTGKLESAWDKDELKRYCEIYGITLEEFINRKIEIG